MFERVDYTVSRIDGDYACLLQKEDPSAEEKCVARALLPPEIYEGCQLKYEMMSYEML
ncbi:MAG: chorismate--pyruvate lyase [Lachnospiraceae bacterium]|nr:chorismate--pyruvate lyase [Lachnospiraceae bacterium]MDD3794657.1 chorismate--pyruvate lyase [Lachnospiraceae bacterium]